MSIYSLINFKVNNQKVISQKPKVPLDIFWSGLQNDHKALMAEIEEALHKLHAREKAKREQDDAEAQEEAMEHQVTLPPPFARVDTVTDGSPASGAVSDKNFFNK